MFLDLNAERIKLISLLGYCGCEECDIDNIHVHIYLYNYGVISIVQHLLATRWSVRSPVK